MKRIILILLTSLILVGCYNHEPSTPGIATMVKNEQPMASLNNKKLSMRVVTGTGVFHHLKDVTFLRVCDAQGHVKTYLPGNMQFLYGGTYTYHVSRQKDKAYLILRLLGQRASVQRVLYVRLYFRNHQAGRFYAKLVRGVQGTQEGFFEVND